MEMLKETCDTPGFKVMMKVLDRVVGEKLDRVVQYSLETGDDRSLAMLKARLEGSQQTAKNFQQLLIKINRSKPE